jgi:hypothetical protein
MIAAIFLALAAAATTPSAESTDKIAVMATVDALLAAVSARDKAAGLAQLRASGTATVLMERPDGSVTVRNFPLATYADATPGPERYEEKMIDPAIDVAGNMATVWGRYSFAIDGTVRHCGVQHFDLIREGGSWKVQNVTWSVRITGCGN